MRIALIVTVLLLGLAAAAAWWAKPLFAMSQLKSAIQARDESKVADLVDFEKLEANVGRHLDQRIEDKNDGKFLGSVRGKVESWITGIVLEDLATPEGLIHVSCDTDAEGNIDRSPKAPGTPCEFDADISSVRYVSNNVFEVRAQRDEKDEIGMVMERGADTQWRLISVTGSGPLSE